MKTRAIIIKKQPTNEYDQLVACYTKEYGKMTAIAKSVLKQNSIQAMHLDVLNLVDFELINGRGMPIITGAQSENTFSYLKNSLPALAVAYFFVEVMDKIVFDNEKDDLLWNFLTGLFGELNEGSINQSDLLALFRKKQLELLTILGYSPNLTECTFCSAHSQGSYMAFSVEPPGIVCKDCFLSGRKGILLKREDLLVLKGEKDKISSRFSHSVLDSIFESVKGSRLNSLSFLSNVVK